MRLWRFLGSGLRGPVRRCRVTTARRHTCSDASSSRAPPRPDSLTLCADSVPREHKHSKQAADADANVRAWW